MQARVDLGAWVELGRRMQFPLLGRTAAMQERFSGNGALLYSTGSEAAVESSYLLRTVQQSSQQLTLVAWGYDGPTRTYYGLPGSNKLTGQARVCDERNAATRIPF